MMLDAAYLASNVSVWKPSNRSDWIKKRSAWMNAFCFTLLLFCLAHQGHLFTIGTELMKSREEEVNFDGHFYTFSGFNVSIFATRLS